MTLSDAQEVALLASMEHQSDGNEGHSVNSDEKEGETAEKMAWDFHD